MTGRFREDENELPYLVYSKRDDYNDRRKGGGENSSKLYESARELIDENKLDEALELINILMTEIPKIIDIGIQKALFMQILL